MKIESIPVAEIYGDPVFNCRGFISPINVTDIAQSMREKGLLQPIVIRTWGGKPGKKYRAVVGHRRLKAAEIIGWELISAIIRDDLSDEQAQELNIIENIQRDDLNILQEARAIERFQKRGVTQTDIANMLKKPRGWVQVRFFLLDLPDDIQAEAAAGLLTNQHIRDLRGEPSKEKQYEMVRLIKDRKLNGERAPKLKKTVKKNIFTKKRREREEIFEMLDHIAEHVGYSFATRAMAWCAGEISDLDFYSEIRRVCDEEGVRYTMPKDILPAMAFAIPVGIEDEKEAVPALS